MIGSVFQNNTYENLVFGPIILTADHITGATGKTLTVTISKNGGAFAAPVGAVTEVGNGMYMIAANAIDANTVGLLSIHATATACDPYDDKYDVLPAVQSSSVTPAPASSLSSFNITAQDLISGALKLLGVLAAGETLKPADAVDGFARLNELIDSWGTQRMTMFTTARSVYSLVSGTRDYTIGPGGTFNQARPMFIDAVSIIPNFTPAIEVPISLYSDDQWAALPYKTFATGWVNAIYYDYADASLLGTISIYPTINVSGFSLVLYTPTAVTQFADLTTIYSLPPGYAKALRFNLAVTLAPEYGLTPLPAVSVGADDSLAWVKRSNTRLPELSMPVELRSCYGPSNIYTGQ